MNEKVYYLFLADSWRTCDSSVPINKNSNSFKTIIHRHHWILIHGINLCETLTRRRNFSKNHYRLLSIVPVSFLINSTASFPSMPTRWGQLVGCSSNMDCVEYYLTETVILHLNASIYRCKKRKRPPIFHKVYWLK